MDHHEEQRKQIALNMPGITLLLLGEQTDNDDEEGVEDDYEECLQFWKEHVLPLYDKLAKDSSEEVRAASALVLHELMKILGNDLSSLYLLPFFHRFMEESHHEVLLSFLSNIEVCVKILAYDKVPLHLFLLFYRIFDYLS